MPVANYLLLRVRSSQNDEPRSIINIIINKCFSKREEVKRWVLDDTRRERIRKEISTTTIARAYLHTLTCWRWYTSIHSYFSGRSWCVHVCERCVGERCEEMENKIIIILAHYSPLWFLFNARIYFVFIRSQFFIIYSHYDFLEHSFHRRSARGGRWHRPRWLWQTFVRAIKSPGDCMASRVICRSPWLRAMCAHHYCALTRQMPATKTEHCASSFYAGKKKRIKINTSGIVKEYMYRSARNTDHKQHCILNVKYLYCLWLQSSLGMAHWPTRMIFDMVSAHFSFHLYLWVPSSLLFHFNKLSIEMVSKLTKRRVVRMVTIGWQHYAAISKVHEANLNEYLRFSPRLSPVSAHVRQQYPFNKLNRIIVMAHVH